MSKVHYKTVFYIGVLKKADEHAVEEKTFKERLASKPEAMKRCES
jgi:hypothetical protein